MGVAVPFRKRTPSQNALLHSALHDISDQVLWFDRKLSISVWKRLCTAAWLREIGEEVELVPALDGDGFDIIYEKTSRLDTAQLSELLEWTWCFGAQHGVTFKLV